ncbi:IS4 family transposase [Methylobacter sp.]|uniref:IS4 family transposase n=1 Tax=Methylobacter sp. TaxID=2051955 RepID=UPI003DA497D1
MRRSRKITGSNFVKALLFAWTQNHSPSVEGIARAGYSHGLRISAQGLDKRFTPAASDLMRGVLEAAVAQVVTASHEVDIDLLNRFTAVYLADTSTVTLPTELETVWQGVGGSGNASQAAVKIDTCLELKTGQLHLGLLPGRHSDNRSPIAESVYEPGSLRLQDLGYFNLARMKEQDQRGEYWISRLRTRTQVLTLGGDPIDVPAYLHALSKQGIVRHERTVKVGASEHLNVRWLVWQLPEETAAQRRATMRDRAQKHGRMPRAESLAWCDWQMLITNIEPEKLTQDECFLLYGARWQIELMFKLWKTHGRLGYSHSEKPQRILCELYAKLLSVLVQHWIVLTGLWRRPHRSLVKGCQMIKEQSARLAHCIDDFDVLVELLEELADRFEQGCSLNARKKKPNTSQQLEAGSAFL